MHYEIYKDGQGQYRWRLRAANGEIVADSGEGYVAEDDCRRGIELVKGSGDAPVQNV